MTVAFGTFRSLALSACMALHISCIIMHAARIHECTQGTSLYMCPWTCVRLVVNKSIASSVSSPRENGTAETRGAVQ